MMAVCVCLDFACKSRLPLDMARDVVTSSPEVLGGTPVFAGTRVPVQTLLDYLKAGDSINEFLAGFPSVTRDQVLAFLGEAEKQIVAMVS